MPAGPKEKVHARQLASPASRPNRGAHHHRAHITLRALRICHGAMRAPPKKQSPGRQPGLPVWTRPVRGGWRGLDGPTTQLTAAFACSALPVAPPEHKFQGGSGTAQTRHVRGSSTGPGALGPAGSCQGSFLFEAIERLAQKAPLWWAGLSLTEGCNTLVVPRNGWTTVASCQTSHGLQA